MITRIYTSVLPLWLLIDHVLSQPTTATSSTLTNSIFKSPLSSRIIARGLTEDDKIGVSIGVTFAAIILVGATAILCVIKRRRTALTKPQTRALGPGEEIDDESAVAGDDFGKGKDAYHMSPPQGSHRVLIQQAPDGTVYQATGYPPTISQQQTYAPQQQTYAPQQQAYAMQHQAIHPGDTSPYSSTAYPGLEALDPSQQNGFAGPSNAQYLSDARMQARQQQGDNISWRHPSSATSPIEGFPAPDLEDKFLQDYQQQEYYIPPPRPDTIELPEQRKVLELMGEGHLKEVP